MAMSSNSRTSTSGRSPEPYLTTEDTEGTENPLKLARQKTEYGRQKNPFTLVIMSGVQGVLRASVVNE